MTRGETRGRKKHANRQHTPLTSAQPFWISGGGVRGGESERVLCVVRCSVPQRTCFLPACTRWRSRSMRAKAPRSGVWWSRGERAPSTLHCMWFAPARCHVRASSGPAAGSALGSVHSSRHEKMTQPEKIPAGRGLRYAALSCHGLCTPCFGVARSKACAWKCAFLSRGLPLTGRVCSLLALRRSLRKQDRRLSSLMSAMDGGVRTYPTTPVPPSGAAVQRAASTKEGAAPGRAFSRLFALVAPSKYGNAELQCA